MNSEGAMVKGEGEWSMVNGELWRFWSWIRMWLISF